MPASLRSALLMLQRLATKQVVVKGPDGVRIPQKEFQAGSKTKLKLADSNVSLREKFEKLREKLEKLGEKAGVPKEKTKPNPKNQDSPSENPEK